MKLIDGLWWPDHDLECHPVLKGQSADIEVVLKYVTDFSVCIQAGGNVGLFPKLLSTWFSEVYTFEPEGMNYNCLIRNITELNIRYFHAFLSDKHELASVKPPDKKHINNCGAYQVCPGNDVWSTRIDDLHLNPGLIYLDIEGYELFALKGAVETIKRSRPVISIEDKPLPEKYGVELGEPVRWLEGLGYKVAEKIHRDVICIPSS